MQVNWKSAYAAFDQRVQVGDFNFVTVYLYLAI